MTGSVRFVDLSWPEVATAIDAGAGVLVPIGSTEQHGAHLPLSVDTTLAEDLAVAVAQDAGFLVAPAIAYGYRSRPLSGGGPGFVGTTSLSGKTFMALVEDVVTQLLRQGFRRIGLLNWHYENQNFIYESAHLAIERTGITDATILVAEMGFDRLSQHATETLFPDGFPGWDVEHASILETSLMLHLHPDAVRMDKAVDDAAERHPWYDVVPVPAAFVPKSGVLWKATQATEAKGRLAWDEIVAAMRDAVELELLGSRAGVAGRRNC